MLPGIRGLVGGRVWTVITIIIKVTVVILTFKKISVTVITFILILLSVRHPVK